MPTGWFIDANLLVLLVVGVTDPRIIRKHRRLKAYSEDDYKRLLDKLASAMSSSDPTGSTGAGVVLVTPNTLTEASNLLAYHQEPERSRLFDTLRILIENNKEVVVKSVTAARAPTFMKLGLTDTVLLEVVSPETPLLTVDLDLYHAVAKRNHRAAENFTHLRSL